MRTSQVKAYGETYIAYIHRRFHDLTFFLLHVAARGLGEGRSAIAVEGDAREKLQYRRHNRSLHNSSKNHLHHVS